MPKSIKILLIVLSVVAAVPAGLFAALWIWFSYETAKVDRFYHDNRLFGAMREVEKQSTNDSASARDAMLKMIPLGTGKGTVIAFLRNEGLGCRAKAEPVTNIEPQKRLLEGHVTADSLTKKEWLECQAMTPNVMGYKQWIVSLEFDAEKHLSDARVAIWNIFL
ncbi:hypothetical protein [Bradyrhizobium sp. WSM2793]|uniref:hypothetical protein n=1 Tax=Bradyrhizobium sp. WSM2793 TaxID=1038866 RepID=UPI0012F74AF2|nr:hypothetical protein [Bradyrhizobium sp. WSM2793]